MALWHEGVTAAIEILSGTKLGKGRIDARIEPDAWHRARYSQAGPVVVRFLRTLNPDSIEFLPLGAGHYGSENPHWPGEPVSMQVNREFLDRGDVCGLACILVHEGVHLYGRLAADRLDEEVLIRGLESVYIRELAHGVEIPAKLRTSALTPARASLTDPRLFPSYRSTKSYQATLMPHEFIDWILRIATLGNYRGEVTLRWIARSAEWWGGLAARHALTLGIYLDSILYNNPGSSLSTDLVLRILTALPGNLAGFPRLPHPTDFPQALDSMLDGFRPIGRPPLERIGRFLAGRQPHLDQRQQAQLDEIREGFRDAGRPIPLLRP